MEDYKIYIDSDGIIKAILLPEEINFIAFGAVNSHQFNLKMLEQYEEALSKAKQEAVPFKDQELIGKSLLLNGDFDSKTWNELKNTIHDIPEGYSVEVEEEPMCEEHCGDCLFYDWYACHENGTREIFATIKKISPSLSVEKEDDNEKSQEEISSLRSMIGNLLAILHGDGGHYQDKHGTLKAISDAIKLIHTKWVTNEHLRDINESEQEIIGLRKQLNAADDVIKYSSYDSKKGHSGVYLEALEKYQKLKEKI